MKKVRFKIIALGLFFGLLIVLFSYILNIRKTYINNINKIQNPGVSYWYEFPFLYYFENNSEYPATIEESFLLEPDDVDFDQYIKYHYSDYLSKDKKLIQYVPLFNRNNFKIEAFLLISTGIDGHLNNNISLNDTLFIDTLNKPFKFYNTTNPYKLGDQINEYSSFNLFDYFFGHKDYLISYVNCHNYYTSQIHNIYSLQELIKRIKRYNYFEQAHKVAKQLYGYYSTISNDTVIDNIRYIYFKSNEYTIKNKLYNSDFEAKIGDSVTFVGLLVSFDPKEKVIMFNNCFLLDSIPEHLP